MPDLRPSPIGERWKTLHDQAVACSGWPARLTEWEQDFLQDMIERLSDYKGRALLSAKQINRLREIGRVALAGTDSPHAST